MTSLNTVIWFVKPFLDVFSHITGDDYNSVLFSLQILARVDMDRVSSLQFQAFQISKS